MLKDTGIPPYAISLKNVCEGASVFNMKSHRDNTPHGIGKRRYLPMIKKENLKQVLLALDYIKKAHKEEYVKEWISFDCCITVDFKNEKLYIQKTRV